jgi:hypothetical protein
MEQEAAACSVCSHDPLLESDPSMEPDRDGFNGMSVAVVFVIVTTVRFIRVLTAIEPKSKAFVLTVTLPPPHPAKNGNKPKRRARMEMPDANAS